MSGLPHELRAVSNLGPEPSTNGKAPEPPRRTLTDYGNAERFVDEHGRRFRYCGPWGKELVYDETRWIRDETGETERMMKSTVRGIYAEAAGIEGERERKAVADHAKRSEAAKRIADALRLARSEPGIPIKPEDLDRDPWLLNVSNGTVDLRTGELGGHRPENLITKIVPVEYDPGAAAPTWDAFLARVLPSEALRRFLQRVIGYAAAGVVTEEVLVILHGGGANGKSTLINAVMEALGEYAIQAAPDLLMAKKGAHPTELADLFGARFVASVETDEGRHLAEGLVKQLTGRDPIKARRMREDFWQFLPTHTPFLSTNHRPEIRGTDHAIWRRIKLVPFEVTIPEREQDKGLADKLRAELPGILAWIVRGCLEWRREGLGEPEEVRAATTSYRAEMDVLSAFIEDRCVVDPGVLARFSDLWAEWQEWCDEAGERAETKRRFGSRLKERGFEPDRGNGNVPIRRGIRLREDRDPDPEGGSRVTPEGENYPTPTGGNPHSYAESGDESYPSYPESPINDKNPPYGASCEKQGNLGNLGNSEPAATPRGSSSRPPTAEEVQRYRRLVAEGMKPSIARAEVIKGSGGVV